MNKGRLCDPASWLPLAYRMSSRNPASIFLPMSVYIRLDLVCRVFWLLSRSSRSSRIHFFALPSSLTMYAYCVSSAWCSWWTTYLSYAKAASSLWYLFVDKTLIMPNLPFISMTRRHLMLPARRAARACVQCSSLVRSTDVGSFRMIYQFVA